MATFINDCDHDWPAVPVGLCFGSSCDLLRIVQGKHEPGFHGERQYIVIKKARQVSLLACLVIIS
jgi:hypothetical protein